MEWLETNLKVEVAQAEYRRLLGFPSGHVPEERVCELMRQAAEWYAAHGRPWMYLAEPSALEASNGKVRIAGQEFSSEPLASMARQTGAHAAAVSLVSAGADCEKRAAQLWAEEKPDEYFFLEIFGSAVVENLVQQAGAKLCAWADTQGCAVLPHYSPGYTGWDVADQVRLFSLAQPASRRWPEEVTVLDGGMLRPKKSLLALFGLTSDLEKARAVSNLVPCQTCSFAPCRFRRAPYREPRVIFEDVSRLQPAAAGSLVTAAPRLKTDATYVTSMRALKKWVVERLKLTGSAEEGYEATFRYEGTTCSNLGWPLLFEYQVRLGPAADGYRIEETRCDPAADDTGHTRMCRYLQDGPGLMQAIATEKPLLGKPLETVLAWYRPHGPAGCYCEGSSRDHKWGLVLEVLHYALAQREGMDYRKEAIS